MIDLKEYGYIDQVPPAAGSIAGRVIELQREQYTVMTKYGEVSAALKGTFYHSAEMRQDFPCVGDFVLLQYNESGPSRINQLLPRRTKFSRADFSGHADGYAKTVLEQVVAANFDFVFILSSLNWDFNTSRILRYITQARQSGGAPVIILTKADLMDDLDAPLRAVRAVASDIPVHAISSHTGFGLEALDNYLMPGKTVVFLGMSGVGKSSLLNALMQQEVMAVKAIREGDSRGRHTTTHRQLFMLPSGAMVIDTPGMRELGLFDAGDAISAGFSDIEGLFSQCRFRDCQHQTEPGCAVLAALANGALSRRRWELYLSQKREAAFMEDKTGYLRERSEKFKSMSKNIRKQYKDRGKY
jgi:ribosome small subunit-dependent GTPase A